MPKGARIRDFFAFKLFLKKIKKALLFVVKWAKISITSGKKCEKVRQSGTKW